MNTEIKECEQGHNFVHAGVYLLQTTSSTSNFTNKTLYDKYYCSRCLSVRYKFTGSLSRIDTEASKRYPAVAESEVKEHGDKFPHY